MEVVREGGAMLTVTQTGYGKRTDIDEYRVQSRGGFGIINIQTSDRNGKVVGIAYVHGDDELMLISQQGKILRMVTSDIRAIGRATQGVRLIGMDEGDQVVSVARLAEKEVEEAVAAAGASTEPVAGVTGTGGPETVQPERTGPETTEPETAAPEIPESGTGDDE